MACEATTEDENGESTVLVSPTCAFSPGTGHQAVRTLPSARARGARHWSAGHFRCSVCRRRGRQCASAPLHVPARAMGACRRHRRAGGSWRRQGETCKRLSVARELCDLFGATGIHPRRRMRRRRRERRDARHAAQGPVPRLPAGSATSAHQCPRSIEISSAWWAVGSVWRPDRGRSVSATTGCP
jgi:hypothetical protein